MSESGVVDAWVYDIYETEQILLPSSLSNSINNHVRVWWSCNIVSKTTKLKTKTKTEKFGLKAKTKTMT